MTERIIKLRVEEVEGDPTIPGLISASRACEILGVSRNTVKKYAREGKIGYFITDHKEPSESIHLVKSDVEKYKNDMIKKQIKKIKKLQKGG